MKKSIVEIFTDGACRGNPGPGGWGVYMRYGEKTKELYGADPHTTNNRMELTAVIKGLEAIKPGFKVSITTDSRYVHDGVTMWLKKWQKNGWKTADHKMIKNVELWQELSHIISIHEIEWHWVRGHAGHRENEIADGLANKAIDEMGEMKSEV